MRRPVMYLAGLLLATGASLALAGPASAAPSHDTKCHHNQHGGGAANDEWDGTTRVVIIHDGFDGDFPYGNGYYSNHEGHAYGLINLLSGNGGDGLSL
jgi:hypothetical protein